MPFTHHIPGSDAGRPVPVGTGAVRPPDLPGTTHHTLATVRDHRPVAPPTIVAASTVMVDLLADLRRLAPTAAKVLITGESGVGKDLVASYIHACSPRSSRPFVAVNCAGLTETLLESELFGHVKGSFTGAFRDKPGKFEAAHTGTLFLDEVGEMTLRMQGLLLRVLQTGELQKVGSDRAAARVDCRVIAATNRSLADLIDTGAFRQDLYYRLNVIHVHVRPLRERREDIPPLVDHFLQQLAATQAVPAISRDLYEALCAYNWPGNVRQLENVVQRLVVNATRNALTAADLPDEIREKIVPLLVPEPRVERRRTAASLLYKQLRDGASFWTTVHQPYIEREITRRDVREVVRLGLEEARGNYRIVTRLFNVEHGDYRRLLNFLRKHKCLLAYREYREYR